MRIGEEVRVSGTAPALGFGKPERAIRMVTTPSTFPMWTTKEPIFLPGDQGANRLTYRYAVFCGGIFKRWEGEGNFFRSLDAPSTERRGISRITDDVLDNPKNDKAVMKQKSTGGKKEDSATSLNKASEVRSYKAHHFEAWGRSCAIADKQQITTSDRVLVVSYFLPVILSLSEDGKWSAEWDNENILSLEKDMGSTHSMDKINWVGSVRYKGGAIPADQEQAVSNVLHNMHCYPVYISAEMHHQFYDVFCKQQLWMILHHVADVYGPLNHSDIGAKAQQELWYIYSTVNRMFKEKVVEAFAHGDLVWIHGFHLMLLPSFLRRVMALAKIGYFFHTPFPSSEIWRTMSRREDLLRGILAADQVGFHLYEYARQFTMTCHRVLGYRSEMNANGCLAVAVDDREVIITCIHVGIDDSKIKKATKDPGFDANVTQWRQKFQGKIVVGGTDRLERLKGIPLKLIAIDTFLSENPKWIGKICFSIVGITAAERGDDYKLTLRDVKIMTKAINTKHGAGSGDVVVHFVEQTEREFNLAQRLAYFSACDMLMVTPTRDGLNRLPMEYVMARQLVAEQAVARNLPVPHCSGQNIVIVSEFISCARVMRGAFTVNPWRVQDVSKALSQALEIDSVQLSHRFITNIKLCTQLTTQTWAIQVLSDLKAVEKDQNQVSTMALGFGMGFKVMGFTAGFNPVDPVAVSKAYRNSRSRLIVLDWGGTLVSDDDKTDKLRAYALATGKTTRVGPTLKLTKLLEKLASDVRNNVFIISGKELMAVSEYFGHIKNLGLGAEHGFYYRWPREHFLAGERPRRNSDSTEPSRAETPAESDDSDFDGQSASRCKWQTLTEIGDQTWKDSARIMMEIFVQRTHGTYIEVKGNALIWQFRDADPEFGFLQSKELEEHLKQILKDCTQVEVIRGGGAANGHIEVRPAGVNKGLFLEHAINTLKNLQRDPTFVLAIGDDGSDEPMFELIQKIQSEEKESVDGFGVTVGKKPSAAGAYVEDPLGVMELLTTLSRSSDRDNRYYSTADLPSQLASQKARQAFVQRALQSPGMANSSGPTTTAQLVHPPQPTSLSTGAATIFGTDVGRMKPEHRAMSVGNLALASAPLQPSIMRTVSSSHLTMNNYLASINDSNNEEGDDAGIFF